MLNSIVRFAALGLALLVLAACSGPTAAKFPNLHWTYDAKDADVQFSAPVVADGGVYLAGQAATEGHGGRLVALDEATGAVKWDVAFEDLTMAEPIVQGDRVLAVDRDGQKRILLAVDAGSGQQRWRGPYLRGNPVVTEKLAWLITADNELVALDLADGSQVFSRTVGPRTAESLVIADGIVYLGDPDGQLLALDAADGKLLWQAETEPRGYYDMAVVAAGLVFLDAPLKAFDV